MLRKYKIENITDISGFGLALHLRNLLLRNNDFTGAEIYLDKILMLDGAKHALEKKVVSSLNYSNKFSLNNSLKIVSKNKKYLNILFDPQTAAGFLFITNKDSEIVKDFKANNIIFSEIGTVSYSHNKIKVL